MLSPCSASNGVVALAIEVEAVGARPELEQRRARIEPVPAELRLDGVAIRGERVALDEDLVTLRRRPEERREHQVQVHGQRVHRDDLVAMRAHEIGEQRRELRVIVEPAAVRGTQGARPAPRRPRVGKMTVDAERRPALELRVDAASGRARHEAERVAAQVSQRAASPRAAARTRAAGEPARRRHRARARRLRPARTSAWPRLSSAASRCRSACTCAR